MARNTEQEVGKLRVNWGRLILGILYVITAIYGYAHPASNVTVLALIFIISMIVRSVWFLTAASKIKNWTGRSFLPLMLIGILELIISIVLLANQTASVRLLSVLFALWFLADAIGSLFSTWSNWGVMVMGKFWRTLFGIFEIYLGIHMLINPSVATVAIGYLISTNFLIGGIIQIATSFSREAVWEF